MVIWASPGTARQRLAGIGIGVPLLLALNLLRIVHVYVIGATRPQLFDFFHGVVWEALIVAAVVGIWWTWLEATRSETRRPAGNIAPYAPQ